MGNDTDFIMLLIISQQNPVDMIYDQLHVHL